MNFKSLKPLEIVGGVIFLIGIVYWFATPSDVTTGPAVVIAIGAAIIGISKLVDRSKEDESAEHLMEQLRSERAQEDSDGPAHG